VKVLTIVNRDGRVVDTAADSAAAKQARMDECTAAVIRAIEAAGIADDTGQLAEILRVIRNMDSGTRLTEGVS